MASSCPYVVEVEMDKGALTAVAEATTPTQAMAALKTAAARFPDARVLLFVNGRPTIEYGPEGLR